MKKVGFLGFFFVLALMFLGIGYAAWTDAVTVTSIVSTGEMEVEFVPYCCNDTVIWDEAYSVTYADGEIVSGQGEGILYAEAIPGDFNSDSVSVSVSNVYPGVSWFTAFSIANTGTIPAVYDYVEFDYEGNDALAKVLLDNVSIYTVDMLGQETLYSSYNETTPLYNLGDVVNEALNGMRLEPQTGICIKVLHRFPITIDNEDNLEDTSVYYSATINFRQHNVLPTAIQ